MQTIVKKCCSGVLSPHSDCSIQPWIWKYSLGKLHGFSSGVLDTPTATHKHRREGIYEEHNFVVENRAGLIQSCCCACTTGIQRQNQKLGLVAAHKNLIFSTCSFPSRDYFIADSASEKI